MSNYIAYVTEKKIITCLDGKERVFRFYDNGGIYYNIFKNGKSYGCTNCLTLNGKLKEKLPKFITKEMLGVK